MKFIASSYELHIVLFEVHMKYKCVSNPIHAPFNPYEFDMSFIWSSYKFYTNVFVNTLSWPRYKCIAVYIITANMVYIVNIVSLRRDCLGNYVYVREVIVAIYLFLVACFANVPFQVTSCSRLIGWLISIYVFTDNKVFLVFQKALGDMPFI